jgi:hypothetical protein
LAADLAGFLIPHEIGPALLVARVGRASAETGVSDTLHLANPAFGPQADFDGVLFERPVFSLLRVDLHCGGLCTRL